MAKGKSKLARRHAPEFRQQMVELVRGGRTLRDETDALRGGEPSEPAPPAAGALPDDHE